MDHTSATTITPPDAAARRRKRCKLCLRAGKETPARWLIAGCIGAGTCDPPYQLPPKHLCGNHYLAAQAEAPKGVKLIATAIPLPAATGAVPVEGAGTWPAAEVGTGSARGA